MVPGTDCKTNFVVTYLVCKLELELDVGFVGVEVGADGVPVGLLPLAFPALPPPPFGGPVTVMGATVGDAVGDLEGAVVVTGALKGAAVKEKVGFWTVGEAVGDRVGGAGTGALVGDRVGGAGTGATVGDRVGAGTGATVGERVRAGTGAAVGERVGARVGNRVGAFVGLLVRALVVATVGAAVGGAGMETDPCTAKLNELTEA